MANESRYRAQVDELYAVKEMLKINIDGDWDEEMIGTAFDNIESLLCGEVLSDEPASRQTASTSRRRRRR